MKALAFTIIVTLFSSYSSSDLNNSIVNEEKVALEARLLNLKSVKDNKVSNTVLVQLSNDASLHWVNRRTIC